MESFFLLLQLPDYSFAVHSLIIMFAVGTASYYSAAHSTIVNVAVTTARLCLSSSWRIFVEKRW